LPAPDKAHKSQPIGYNAGTLWSYAVFFIQITCFYLFVIGTLGPLSVIYYLMARKWSHRILYLGLGMLQVTWGVLLLFWNYMWCSMVRPSLYSWEWWWEFSGKMMKEPATFSAIGLVMTGLAIIVYGLVTAKGNPPAM
jgi:hypothetical protein